MASTVTPPIEMPTEIHWVDIFNGFYRVIRFIIMTTLYRIRDAWHFVRYLISITEWLIGVIFQGFPFYMIIIIVIILCIVLWDDVVKPLILILVNDAYNGAIRTWNGIAGSVSNFGVEIGFPGIGSTYVPLGIPIPSGNEVQLDLPNFVPWVTTVLIPILFIPLKKSLTGIIFAEDPEPY